MQPEHDVGYYRPVIGSIKDAVLEVRLGFVRKVYGILSAQLLLSVAVAAPLATTAPSWLARHSWLLYLSVAMTIGTLCAMTCCQEVARQYPTNYLFLFLFTFFEGVMIGFASASYTWQSVVLAAGITCVVFLVMSFYAWNTRTDYTGCGPYLFGALAVLSIFGFLLCGLSLFGVRISWTVMFFNICGVFLFTFYIIYDTQLIIGEWGGHKSEFGVDDYAFASLTLYLDIINLFLHLLSLLGNQRQ
eukprot:TRINITY_DN66075_c0_g1_i1.p1 TRINITY_DN66075_c0_g1~~TRINITY_DN66075_c0_g1_i1.p1  ORF type:complete len:263 (-),score=34.21 TRINITY_DN66075_c0_g1_i1:218-952(-)